MDIKDTGTMHRPLKSRSFFFLIFSIAALIALKVFYITLTETAQSYHGAMVSLQKSDYRPMSSEARKVDFPKYEKYNEEEPMKLKGEGKPQLPNDKPASQGAVSPKTSNQQTHPVTPKTENIVQKSSVARESNRKPLILAWTPLTSKKPLWGIKPYTFRTCEYNNCEITADRNRLEEADLLLFRIRNLKPHSNGLSYRPYVSHLDLSDLPTHHKAGQLWMDINQESPVYTHADEELQSLNGVFNLSVNYLLDSDFSISYIPHVAKRESATKPIDYSQGKTKMALWFVSHCQATSGRDEYVAELQKYNISVDIFGRCTGKSDGCSAGNTTCYAEVRKRYKFYLALENSICTEYITEKFWNTLSSDSYNIPIALGASLSEYEKVSPPNSYLHTRNFTSIKALAEYMHRIDKDNSLFNGYHRWRETHYIKHREQPESLQCYMCRAAIVKVEGNPSYKNLTSYWSRRKNCEISPEPLT